MRDTEFTPITQLVSCAGGLIAAQQNP